MNQEYVRTINRVVDVHAAHFCSCTFPINDKYGKYEGYKPHNGWELHHQDHSNHNFADFLQCTGCGYQLARQYWTKHDDNGHHFVDYTKPVISN